MIQLIRTLLPLVLAVAPGIAQEQSPEGEAQTEEASQSAEALVLPDSPEAALEMRPDLEEILEGRGVDELGEFLQSWIAIARSQSKALDNALATPDGSPERDAAAGLRTDLDALLAGTDTVCEAAAAAGADVEQARKVISELRRDDTEVLKTSTVPPNRHQALELSVEVLKAQLRPLTREQVAVQLGQWLEFLQRTCLEVRNIEVSALQTDDPEQVVDFSARAVALRGERAQLIKRVNAVIGALELKGGDVSVARTYVNSVVAKPPITGLTAAWSTIRAWITDTEGGIALGLSFSFAIAIFIAFWFLAKGLARVARSATRSLGASSELLREFITSSVRRLTIIIGLLIALSTLGVNMTPLVAAIGAAGLVVGLALQGTLGNLASGLMIMVYRPFDVGDSVKIAGVAGKVSGMTLMTTAVVTFDNQAIHVPNNKIWGDVITNVTANPTRRVDMTFGIGYEDDIPRAKQILERIIKENAMVLADPAPNIRVNELGDSSVNLIVRPWTNTADYWDVYWDITEQVKRTFDEEGISIPFPQRDVHVIQPQSPSGDAGVLTPQTPADKQSPEVKQKS